MLLFGNLKQMYERLGARRCTTLLREALEEGKVKASDFSLHEMALAFMGSGWVRKLDAHSVGEIGLLEAGEAVDTTMFANITGQIVYSELMAGWQQEGFIGDRLVRTVPTRLSGEKIAGIGVPDRDGDDIGDGMPYPHVGLSEHFIETPVTTKRGMIIPITKEAIFFDRTGLILDRARMIGERLQTGREKKILDMVWGITNTFKWNGTSYNTYQSSAPWVNVKATNELVDWTDIENAMLVFTDLRDPDTNDPIMVNAQTLLVTPQKLMTAKRIVGATEIRETSATNTVTLSANPIGNFTVLSSALAYQRLVDASVANPANEWLLLDPMKAFCWMENWPITVVQAPANSEAEFTQDIVFRLKASYRGEPAIKEPRATVKSSE